MKEVYLAFLQWVDTTGLDAATKLAGIKAILGVDPNSPEERLPNVPLSGPAISKRFISPRVRAAVFVRDGKKCVYCDSGEGPFHLDHVVPVSRGGSNSIDNLVVACAACNLSKGDRTPEEWCRDSIQ